MNKEFYVVRSATSLSNWVKLGVWSKTNQDPYDCGYASDYATLEQAEEELRRLDIKPDSEILVFSSQKPYTLLRRINRKGEVVNC